MPSPSNVYENYRRQEAVVPLIYIHQIKTHRKEWSNEKGIHKRMAESRWHTCA